MRYSKKTYEDVAVIINKLDNHGLISTENLIIALADLFEADNSKFSRDRFFMACKGVNNATDTN